MKRVLRRIQWVMVLLTVAGLVGSSVEAEVGAVGGPAGSPVVLYEVKAIIDDADPVPSAWRVLGVQAPGRVILNPQGEANGDGKPSLWLDKPSDIALAAWARNSAEGFDVVLSRFAQGSWSVPEVMAGGAGDQIDPFLTGSRLDGTVHLVWVDRSTGGVYHRQAPPDLSAWSVAELVSPPGGGVARRPATAVDEQGLVVVWEAHDGGEGTVPRRIALARHVAGAFVEETIATTWHAGVNHPEIHARPSRVWLEWVDADGEMAWRRQLTSGSWEPVELEPYVTQEELEYHVRGEIRVLATQE